MTRRTGYIADLPGHERPRYRAVRAGLAALPADASLLANAPAVFDQGASGSCTGNALAAAIYTALKFAGTPLPWVPSQRGLYGNGRALSRVRGADGKLPALRDEGAMPSQVWRGASELGIRPMGPPPKDGRYSDVDEWNVNLEPKLDELESDAQQLIIGEYGIYSTGSQRITDIRTAIASGKPVTAAIAGGSAAFQTYYGGILGLLNAPLDHYVVIVGYTTDASGHTVFILRNSWSTQWGENGNARINEDAAQELGDLVVADVRLSVGSDIAISEAA